MRGCDPLLNPLPGAMLTMPSGAVREVTCIEADGTINWRLWRVAVPDNGRLHFACLGDSSADEWRRECVGATVREVGR